MIFAQPAARHQPGSIISSTAMQHRNCFIGAPKLERGLSYAQTKLQTGGPTLMVLRSQSMGSFQVTPAASQFQLQNRQ